MKGKIEKFKIKKSSICLLVILSVIGIFFYAGCSYNLNVNESLSKNHEAILETLLNISTILISVCGINLLFSIIIEVKSKNALINEIIANDVISSPEFYGNMEDEKKLAMYNALESSLFSKYNTVQDMYKSLRQKLQDNISDYYYNECSYSVTCSIQNSFIEKKVSSCIKLRSFEKKKALKDFVLGSFVSKKINGFESCEIDSIKINGNALSDKDYKKVYAEINNLNKQNAYDESIKYIYSHKLNLTDDKDTEISMHYVTRTATDDITSTFRVRCPCKNFSLFYEIKEHDDFRIVCNAYGFLDDADNSTNNQENSNITIKFSDWIFNYDGVTVIILRK